MVDYGFQCGLGKCPCKHNCEKCSYSNECTGCFWFLDCPHNSSNHITYDSNCHSCTTTDPEELAQMMDFANWLIENRKKEQQGS